MGNLEAKSDSNETLTDKTNNEFKEYEKHLAGIDFQNANKELFINQINTFLDKSPFYKCKKLTDLMEKIWNATDDIHFTDYKNSIKQTLSMPENINAFEDNEAFQCAKNLIWDDMRNYLCWELKRDSQISNITSIFARHVMFIMRDNLWSLQPLENLNKEKNKNRIITLLYKIAWCTWVKDEFSHTTILINLLTQVYFKNTDLEKLTKEQRKEIANMCESTSTMATWDGPWYKTRWFWADISKNWYGQEYEIWKDRLNYAINPENNDYSHNKRTLYLNPLYNKDFKLDISILWMDLQEGADKYWNVTIQYNENEQEQTITLTMSQDGLTLENASELAKVGIAYNDKELTLPNRLKGKELTVNMVSSKFRDGTSDEVWFVGTCDWGNWKHPYIKEGDWEIQQNHELWDTELDNQTKEELHNNVAEYQSLQTYLLMCSAKVKPKITLRTGVCPTKMGANYDIKKDERDTKIAQAKQKINNPKTIAKIFKHLNFWNAFNDYGPEEAPKQEKLARCRMAEMFLEAPELVTIVNNNIDNVNIIWPDWDPENFCGKNKDKDARTVWFSWDIVKA